MDLLWCITGAESGESAKYSLTHASQGKSDGVPAMAEYRDMHTLKIVSDGQLVRAPIDDPGLTIVGPVGCHDPIGRHTHFL